METVCFDCSRNQVPGTLSNTARRLQLCYLSKSHDLKHFFWPSSQKSRAESHACNANTQQMASVSRCLIISNGFTTFVRSRVFKSRFHQLTAHAMEYIFVNSSLGYIRSKRNATIKVLFEGGLLNLSESS